MIGLLWLESRVCSCGVWNCGYFYVVFCLGIGDAMVDFGRERRSSHCWDARDSVMFHNSPTNTPLVECAESVQGAKELARHSEVRRCSEALMGTGDRSEEAEHTPLSVIKTSHE